MWAIALLASLGLGLVSSPAVMAVTDFQDTYQGYDIIYHQQYHLLLAIQGEKCYVVDTPQNKEHTLEPGSLPIFSRLRITELSLLTHIRRNSSGEVKETTLEAVRNKYQDLLADFHCLGKHIYEVDFYKTNSGSHTQTAMSCRGKSPGMYADPGDCHAFLRCGYLLSTHETCGHGTAFLDSAHRCVHTGLVPNCHDDDDDDASGGSSDHDGPTTPAPTACQGKSPGDYAYAVDCRVFIRCKWLGTASYGTCPTGMGFSPTLRKCVPAFLVQRCLH